jgi:cysteine-rich repeat protein
VREAFCCEQCDDGTQLDGDGCSATCQVQPCCITQPNRCAADWTVPCDDDGDCARAGVGGLCVGVPCEGICGDGIRQPFCCEKCDDGVDCDTD